MQVLQRYVVNLLEVLGVVELDGAGAGSETILVAPPTAYVEIERVAYSGAGAGAILSIYAGSAVASNLRDGTLTGADRGFGDASSFLRFAPNTPIVVAFTAGTASAAVPVFLQALAVAYRVVDLDETGEGTVVGHGLAVSVTRPSPDPGGWN